MDMFKQPLQAYKKLTVDSLEIYLLACPQLSYLHLDIKNALSRTVRTHDTWITIVL